MVFQRYNINTDIAHVRKLCKILHISWVSLILSKTENLLCPYVVNAQRDYMKTFLSVHLLYFYTVLFYE